MAKMTVIYTMPKDKVFFEEHYFGVHVPLAKQLPGLIRYEINEGPILAITGQVETYRIAHLYFASMQIMQEALRSEIGQQCAADRRLLAGDGDVQIYVYDTKDT